jgi:hypothetical protein
VEQESTQEGIELQEQEGKGAMAWVSTVVRRQLSSNHSAKVLHGLQPQAEQVQEMLEACLSRGSNGTNDIVL